MVCPQLASSMTSKSPLQMHLPSLYSRIILEMCLSCLCRGATTQRGGTNATALRNSGARHPTGDMQSRPTLVFERVCPNFRFVNLATFYHTQFLEGCEDHSYRLRPYERTSGPNRSLNQHELSINAQYAGFNLGDQVSILVCARCGCENKEAGRVECFFDGINIYIVHMYIVLYTHADLPRFSRLYNI